MKFILVVVKIITVFSHNCNVNMLQLFINEIVHFVHIFIFPVIFLLTYEENFSMVKSEMKKRCCMNHNITIGAKVKALRTSKNYTLKQLSEESGLSIGFLSQLERGISSIAIDSLAKISSILEVPLSSFFDENASTSHDPVLHSFNLQCTKATSEIVQYILSNNASEYDILPRLFQLMPLMDAESEDVVMMNHIGEEFIYVLEGIVTVYIGDREYTLYPGDSIQIHSNEKHNWINLTNKVAKLLSINTPNPFKEKGIYDDGN